MLPENYYEKQKERSRLNYHRNKEQYMEKYEERRERCIAYMKGYNKEYYQVRREEILEKSKAYGMETRRKAGQKARNTYIPACIPSGGDAAAEPVIAKVDPSIFTILFDD